ncbi:MAG: hypothetical protein CV087_07180 [Candidatus Brocadia sp. WS118]|nr:MAG: hypothetical protein CV087_07180 [Candidatus Brocadia sp. WS118]
MDKLSRNFGKRIESARIRVKTLSSLRKLVALPPEYNITERQWSVLERGLSTVQDRILSRLKRGAGEHLPRLYSTNAARRLNLLLGEIELEMSRTFVFFDTYMDVLTQRLTPEMGLVLGGCDVLAWDAIIKDHTALNIVEPPLVFCDRGFGASIIREEVLLPDGIPNPMPLIQIPYSRLKEKYNLTSIIHEAGHQVMVRLGLVSVLPKILRYALARAGALETTQDLFALWTSEIGPDFWTFCNTGIAQTGSIKEILALPPNHVFRISWTDPHPAPYLRVLLSFEWCRQLWGRGEWDKWEEEWLMLYPLGNVPEETRKLLVKAREYIPLISRVLLNTKFRVLNRKRIPDLFDLSALDPSRLQRFAITANAGVLSLEGLSPCTQLAVFRVIRDHGKFKEETLDRIMTKWLLKLGKKRKHIH